MADKPKSTADILAAIRKKDGGAAPAPAPAAEASAPAVEETAAAAPAVPVAAAKPAGDAPKGTSSILSSIRSGGAKPAAAGGGDAPRGTSSILSSIRGGGGAAKPAAPAGDKPVARAAAAAAKPAGDRPSVQAMLKAVKEGVKVPEPGARKTPPKLPGDKPDMITVKAGATKGAKTQPQARRSVFAPILGLISTPFALGWTLMTFLTGLFTLKGAQFMMPNMVLELPVTIQSRRRRRLSARDGL